MQWISACDRLPPIEPYGHGLFGGYSAEVIFWMDGGGWDRGRYFTTKGGAYWGDLWGDGSVVNARHVTHWMVIEPPEEVTA